MTRYEAGAVTTAHRPGVSASSSAATPIPAAPAQTAPVQAVSAQAASAVTQQTEQPTEKNHPGFFGRALEKSASAVKSVGSTIHPSHHTGVTQTGAASWYGSDFHGGRTANGERYDMNSMTAAHRTLPFGTLVKVKNLVNGRECVVRINNRGPFTKGRILDMSKAAARELGFMGRGIAKVQMQVLGKGTN